MHFPLIILALTFSLSSILLAAPQISIPLTGRAAPRTPTDLLLLSSPSSSSPFPSRLLSPSVLNNTSPLTYSVPFGLSCYNSEFDRAYINYDTCLPLLFSLSHEDSYRDDKQYISRNPRRLAEGKECEIKVWKGPENVAVNDQYVVAMAAW